MSKKTKNCDIYYENDDKANVYLEVNDLTDCCFEVWETEGKTKSMVKIKIPLEVWKMMLKKWHTANLKEDNSYEYL